MITEPRTRRAVLLGRVSRGERTQDPEGQLAPLRAAAARLGWQVVREVALKVSAWDDEAAAEVRRQALAPIEAGEADTLAIWAWDRFSRRGIEGAFQELRHLEQHLGAQLYSLQEPFLSTATADRQQRELLLSIVSWAARWESQRKSERLRAKVNSKRARAGSLGQRARWGRGSVATWDEIAEVHRLSGLGNSVRRIAAETGISKSQVARLLASVPPQAEGQTEDSEAERPASQGDDRDTHGAPAGKGAAGRVPGRVEKEPQP